VLHGGHYTSLFPFGHTAESYSISTHADADALAEPAVLTPVPVDPQDVALLILGAWPVLDLLLDAAAEKAL
jgi:hypothetical protein